MNTHVDDTADTDLRWQILNTARHLLVRDGYTSLSMRKIARAIGYSATSIYLHFESKDMLFQALIEEGMDQLYVKLEQSASAYPEDPARQLRAICRTYVRYGLENPEYYEIMFMLHPEHVARFPAAKYRRARRNLELVAETLAEGAERQVFQVENPRVTASAIWAALHGAISLLLAQRVDVRVDRDAFIEATIARVVRGLLTSVDAVEAPRRGVSTHL